MSVCFCLDWFFLLNYFCAWKSEIAKQTDKTRLRTKFCNTLPLKIFLLNKATKTLKPLCTRCSPGFYESVKLTPCLHKKLWFMPFLLIWWSHVFPCNFTKQSKVSKVWSDPGLFVKLKLNLKLWEIAPSPPAEGLPLPKVKLFRPILYPNIQAKWYETFKWVWYDLVKNLRPNVLDFHKHNTYVSDLRLLYFWQKYNIPFA